MTDHVLASGLLAGCESPVDVYYVYDPNVHQYLVHTKVNNTIIGFPPRKRRTAGVYLAGPIEGLTYHEANDWRQLAALVLDANGYRVFSPMRGKERFGDFPDMPISPAHLAYADIVPLGRNVMNTDLRDIDESTLVLANLPAVLGYGTPFEVGYAYARHKRIVAFPDGRMQHPFTAAVERMLPTVIDALLYVTALP